MNSISTEADTIKTNFGLNVPIEVNVIVVNTNNIQSTQSSVIPINDDQQEMNDSINKSDPIGRQLMHTFTGCTGNNNVDAHVGINVENDTRIERNDISYRNKFDIGFKDKVENLNSREVKSSSRTLLVPKDEDISKEERNTNINVPSHEGNESFNRFLYELYEKELDLHNKFSNHEIEDIREAVVKQVHLIADAIQEIDNRLKVQEVLLVGSARETQIIRPCGYDFVLILEALSKPGAVSMIPEDTEGDSREYMHIKLKDDYFRSMFREFCDKDCIRATHRLPWNCQGLRDLFTTAVLQAVMLCSKSSIKTDTGTLKLKRSSPKMNGLASNIHLLWERTTTEPHTTMEISTDLCSAIKLDFKEYYGLLPTFDKVVGNDSISIGSVEPELLSSDHAVQRDFAKRLDKLLSRYDNVTSINVNHDTVSELVMPSPDSLASDLFR